jgi:hypothetical protein
MTKARIELDSNVKVIKSGNFPNELSLPENAMAFGKVNGAYDIFINSNGEVSNVTEYIMTSPNGQSVKGRLLITEGVTQDIDIYDLRLLLNINHYELSDNTLNVTSSAWTPPDIDPDNDDIIIIVPPDDEPPDIIPPDEGLI